MKETASLRISVDDLGLYEGVERGVLELTGYGIPIYCSWLTNYLPPSDEFRKREICRSGLHFNVLEGKAALKASELADKGHSFNRRWGEFVWASRKTRIAVEDELEFQIHVLKGWFSNISHLDSHLHLHSIPWLFALMERKQRKYGIEFLRSPYQRFRDDISAFGNPMVVAKLVILRFFSCLNGSGDRSCYGVSRLFSMKCDDVLKIAQAGKREVLWHAARSHVPLDFKTFRFVDDRQISLRESELGQLHRFLAKVTRLDGHCSGEDSVATHR